MWFIPDTEKNIKRVKKSPKGWRPADGDGTQNLLNTSQMLLPSELLEPLSRGAVHYLASLSVSPSQLFTAYSKSRSTYCKQEAETGNETDIKQPWDGVRVQTTHSGDVVDPLCEISKAVRIGDVIHNNHTLQKQKEVHMKRNVSRDLRTSDQKAIGLTPKPTSAMEAIGKHLLSFAKQALAEEVSESLGTRLPVQ